MKKIIRLLLSWLLLFVSASSMMAQNNLLDSISARFLRQLYLFPQEKLYLHTDKPDYVAGDTIWFRAHVVDAANHVPVSVSRYVYVELANQTDSVVHRVRVRVNDSVYSGYLPLDFTLPEDFYCLRAYTPFMENLRQEYLFDKELQVYNPLIKGSGERIETIAGRMEQAALSSSLLSIEQQDSSLYVRSAPALRDKLRSGEKLYLALHCRGVVLFAESWKKEQEQYAFDKESFPAGMMQVLLLDERLKPLESKLVFSENKDAFRIDVATNRLYDGVREKIKYTVSLADKEGKPLKGNFSVSVTNGAFVQTDSIRTIDTYLLRTSDRTGDGKDWNRYDTGSLLQGKYQYPTRPIGNSQELRGITRDYYNHRIKPNEKATLYALGYLFEEQQISDSLGKFRFSGFEFPEGTPYMIRTEWNRGRKTIQAVAEPEVFYPFKARREGLIASRPSKTLDYRTIYQERFDSLSQVLLSVQLGEVVIKADSVRKAGKSVFHSMMGKVKTSEELMTPLPRTLEDMLRRFPGVYIMESVGDSANSGRVVMRGNPNPVFLLDDVPVDYDIVRYMNVNEIDEIEVIADASAAMFGMKGSSGAVLIMTKRGNVTPPDRLSNVVRVVPLGYQLEKSFSPSLTTLYWNPCVSISDEGKASFDFYTSDSKASHTLLIQGVTSDGHVISVKR